MIMKIISFFSDSGVGVFGQVVVVSSDNEDDVDGDENDGGTCYCRCC